MKFKLKGAVKGLRVPEKLFLVVVFGHKLAAAAAAESGEFEISIETEDWLPLQVGSFAYGRGELPKLLREQVLETQVFANRVKLFGDAASPGIAQNHGGGIAQLFRDFSRSYSACRFRHWGSFIRIASGEPQFANGAAELKAEEGGFQLSLTVLDVEGAPAKEVAPRASGGGLPRVAAGPVAAAGPEGLSLQLQEKKG